MSKFFAILYSSLIIIQSFNISFEDISKLNVLLEHATYHQEAYGDSFFDFLTEHYGENSIEHSNDHEEHDDLPFKDKHQTCAHVNAPFTLQTLTFNLEHPSFIEIPFNFFYTDSVSLFEKPNVFQPPKLA